MKLKDYFGDRDFWRITLRLALPVAIQNVLTSSFQLVDTMMVSKLGDRTLSAVGMAAQWAWLAALLVFGLCSGMSVFVSQYWGIKDIKGIRRVLGQGLITCLLLSLIFMAVALLTPVTVLRLFNKDPDVLDIGCKYLRIACFSYPAVALTNVLSTALRNTEKVKLPMYVSFVTTCANAVINYGLIFGKFGMPQMGVAGAAVATCISSWLGVALLLLFSAFKPNIILGPFRELLFTWKHLRVFFQRALPVVLNEGLWSIGILVLNMIYGRQGYEYYAGVTIFKTFSDLCFAFFVGLGNSCVIMVGKSIGKGKIRRGIQDAKRFTVLCILAGFVIGGLCVLLRHPLVSIFSTGDNLSALTLKTALSVTLFCSIELSFRNLGYIQIVGVFRSGGDTLRGMLYDLSSLWLVAIPLAWVTANVLHLPFLAIVVAAYLGEDIPKSILCLLHFKSGKWIIPVTPEGREGLLQYQKSPQS